MTAATSLLSLEVMVLTLLAARGADFPIVAKLAIVATVTLYLGGPIFSMFTHRQPARLKAAPLLSLEIVRQLDPDAATFLRAAAGRLAEMGFVVGAPLRLPTSKSAVGYAIVGEAPNGDIVESYVLSRRVQEQVIRRDWTNFHSHTRNLARTVTSNAVSDSGIPSRAGLNSFSAPGLKDLSRLYQLHQLRAADFGGRRRGAPPAGDHAAFVEAEWVMSTENMIVRGYSRRSGANGETIRLTAKGAFLIAWRQLPPWKNLAEARARRRLAELEARLPRETMLARSA